MKGSSCELIQNVGADDLLLDRQSLLRARLRGRRRLPFERQLDAPVDEDVVRRVDEVEDRGHAAVGHRLIDDLLDLCRRDTNGERRAEHDPELAQGLAGDERRELDYETGLRVEVAMLEHLVEDEVVEGLDAQSLTAIVTSSLQMDATRTSDLIARRWSMAA